MSLVCHSYVTRMYLYVIRMSPVCTRMSCVCHSYVLVCHSYVTCMWFYHESLKSSSFSKTIDLFSVYLIPINNLIFIPSLISSNFFIKIPMPIISIAVLIWFKRSISRAWKKLNSLNRNASSWRKFSCLGLKQSFAIAHDIVQATWMKQVM